MLEKLLLERLDGIKKLVILGAGSHLKADDAAGVIITDRLIERFGEDGCHGLRVYSGNTAPENYTGEIKKFRPDYVLILDAADICAEPGCVSDIRPEVVAGVSFSTHMLPLKVMVEYLKKEAGCGVSILGIQPEDLTYAGEMTPKVREAVDEITGILEKVVLQLELAR